MSAFKKINTEWKFDQLLPDESQQSIDNDLKETEKAINQFVNKWEKDNSYLENSEKLLEALDDYEDLIANYGKGGAAGYYIGLKEVLNQSDPEIKAQYNKIDSFEKKMVNLFQFFELRLAKVDENKQKEFLENKGLEKYKHFLEKLFAESKYILSEPEEKIMNLKSTGAYENWAKMVESFLSKEEKEVKTKDGKTEILNFSQIIGKISDQNKKVRDSAANAINEIFWKHADVAEHEMNAILGDKKVNDEIRGMSRPDLQRHLNDDIDSEVVDALVDTVTKRFDIPQKYYELKAKVLGLDKLAFHERNIEFGSTEKEYKYDESLELVYKVLNDIDSEFGKILKDFNDNSLIDALPKKGKESGAFCTQNLKRYPIFIKLNHNNRLGDVNTIAHEVGHGINHVMMKKQNALHYSIPMSTAEVASTFMEDFVGSELMKDADNELKLSLMMGKLNDDVSTIFRQVACYNLETDLHKTYREKGYLSKEDIGEIYIKNMKAYMGDFVTYEEGSQNWWIYWSHLRYYFYVYSYSSGLLISKSLQASVKNDPKFVEKVKEFLSAGSSDSPKNIFKKLGVDITDKEFWNNGINEVEQLLKETEALAKKLGKI